MQLLVLTTLLTLTAALPTSTADSKRGGCHCTEGYVGEFCGFQFPFLYGDCNPNNIYLCAGGSLYTGNAEMYVDCPARGLSCKDGRYRGGVPELGMDYCDH
jgi:hypothetical protein